MMTIPTYDIGTVSVTALGTVVTSASGSPVWTANIKEGDWIAIDGSQLTMVLGVTDDSHLVIPPWSGVTKTGVAYAAYENYSARDDSVEVAKDVATMLALLNGNAPIWNVPDGQTAPDPSYGEDGQYAYQLSSGKKWIKQSGIWVYLGATDAVFSRYDLTADLPGRPGTGARLARWIVPSSLTMGLNMPESIGNAGVAATASASFVLQKNGATFATIAFGAAGISPSFSAAAQTFVAGDIIDLIAPATRDATLSDLTFAIVTLR